MKKLLYILCLLISFSGFAQTIPTTPIIPIQQSGGPGKMVLGRDIQGAYSGVAYYGAFTDTTAANISPYYKNIAGMTVRTGNTLWIRDTTLQYWIEFGAGSLNIDTTQSIILTGDGSSGNPLTANLTISSQIGNIIQLFPDGVYAATGQDVDCQNGLMSGGRIVLEQNLDYTVTPATYGIGCAPYASVETLITLDASDPVYDRIDLVVVDTNNNVVVITGTPSDDPQNPSFDPLSQLPLSFILVTANATEPTFCRDSIYYISNGQTYTGVVSNAGRINTTSTNNPFSVTEDVEFTLAQNNDQYRVTKSSVIAFATYSVLTFKIRSKATWAINSRVNIRVYAGLTPLGINVALGDGIFGFNSSITNAYQTIVIPIGNLGGGLSTGDNILFTIQTSGANTIGFYIDNIQLLGCEGTPVPVSGRFWSQGGDTWGTLGVIGTLDNFGMEHIVNNTNHTLLQVGGTTHLQGTNPGFSFQLGTFATSDYWLRRSGTDLITNTAGSLINRFQGSQIYSFISASGHIWNGPAAAQQMILAPTGALRLNNYGDNTFTGTATRWLAVDVNGNVIEEAPPVAAITANNGLTASTPTNVQLGGTLIQSTTIAATTFQLKVTGTDAAVTPFRVENPTAGGGTAMEGSANDGAGVSGSSTSGNGVLATSSTGAALSVRTTLSSSAAQVTSNDASTNTVHPTMFIKRTTNGTAANGIGTSLEFYVEQSNTSHNAITNQIISKWTDATTATRTSQMIITGVNSAVAGDILTLNGNKSIQANGYGSGTFTGTPTFTLQVDASGNLIEGTTSAGGLVYTANNGLSMSGNTTQLGGSALIQNSTISTSAFNLNILSSNATHTFRADNTSGGYSIYAVNSASGGSGGGAVYGESVDFYGGDFQSTNLSGINAGSVSSYGITASSVNSVGARISVNPSSTNTIIPILELNRTTTGTGANGIGGSIQMRTETSSGTFLSNEIISTLTDATAGTRTSQFIIRGVNSTATNDILTLNGNGGIVFNDYGINTFAGVAAYVLGVDASGNVVEVAAAGAGMTNVLTTTGDIIYSSSGTTPARLGIGAEGEVLMVTGGIPAWGAAAGTGTVTTVGWTGGIVSIANPTTAPAFTIAGTSGGGVYFSSSSTWASTAALAANALMIGGGAGAAYSTTTTGTGVLTALGVNVGSAGAFVVNGGALGTPSSGTLTNATGLPISTGVSGLGTGVATALAINTGSAGAVVTFNGAGGTPSSLTLTNATGLPISTGVSGLGSSVATALAVNVGTAGSFVVNGGALGTPSSGTISTGVTLGDVTMNVTGTDATGDIYYRSAGGLLTRLAIGSAAQVLTVSGGLPSWSTLGAGGTMTSATLTQPAAGITITNSGVAQTTVASWTVALANDLAAVEGLATTGIVRRTGTSTWSAGTAVSLTTEVTGTLPAANGGTGFTGSTANGQLLIGNGTTWSRNLATGTANEINITNTSGNVQWGMAWHPNEQTLTDAGTTTWNVTNGGNAVWTNNGTGRTLTLSNLVAGYSYTLRLIQGAGGSHTVTTWTNVRWANGTTPTLSTIAGRTDMVTFYCVNSTYLVGYFTPNVQ